MVESNSNPCYPAIEPDPALAGNDDTHHDADTLQLPLRVAAADVGMALYATGFNAWNQLIFEPSMIDDNPDDLYSFTKVLSAPKLHRPAAQLCYTRVQRNEDDDDVCLAGASPDAVIGLEGLRKGVLYCEDATGAVLVVRESEAHSGHISPMTRYPSLSAWGNDTDKSSWPCRLPVKQLAAHDTGFIILYKDGSVDSLGDARFEECLGREVNEPNPAGEPGLVSDLHELDDPVKIVSAGGYTTAAVTEGGGLYIWGTKSPGLRGAKQPFPDISGIPNYVEVDENKDVQDVGIGESHAIALTADGCVYVIGANSNGQLGLGPNSTEFVDSWTKLDFQPPNEYEVTGVEAGPRSSFILTSKLRRT